MKLVIIDDNEIRSNEIESSLPIIESHNKQSYLVNDINNIINSRHKYTHILLHIGNISYNRLNVSINNKSIPIILYSGGPFRLTDAEINAKCFYKIEDIIIKDTLFDANLKQAFRELILYFDNGGNGALPSLLHKIHIPYLSALSILCLGYAIANNIDGCAQNIDFSIRSKIQSHEITTNWWRPVFGENNSNMDEVVAEITQFKKTTDTSNFDKLTALDYLLNNLDIMSCIGNDISEKEADKQLISNVIDKLKFVI